MARTLLFAVVLLALSVFVGSASYHLTHDDAAASVLVTALVSLTVGVLGLVYQARSDPDSVLTFLSVFLLLVALCEAIYVFSSHEPGWVPKSAALMSTIGGVILGVITYRRQFGPGSSDFPNILRSETSPEGILETDGVQFMGFVETGTDDRPHWVSIALQNCFDGPRTVRIEFDAERHSEYLRYHPEFSAELGPAEVRRVRFPVVSPTYAGEYNLFFKVGVDGSGGKRVRLWRAKAPSTRVKGAATAALLAAGVFAYGGGLRFRIGPLQSDLWSADLPAPADEVVWQPEFGTVPAS